MNANEYQELAMRTANKAVLDTQEKKLMNAALGLCGEWGEVLKETYEKSPDDLDRERLVKELGDMWWYVALACDAYGIALDSLYPCGLGYYSGLPRCAESIGGAVARLGKDVAEFADTIKKQYFHGHQTNAWQQSALLCLVTDELCRIGGSLEADQSTVWEANIAKLRARYPEGFSARASIERVV